MTRSPTSLVIGVGNPHRGDDGVGLAVADAVRARDPGAEVVRLESLGPDLFERWDAEARVILVDAAHSGARPGTVHRLDATTQPLPSHLFRLSTHSLGVAEAVEMARALDRLPARLVVYGIEGREFHEGAPLSPEVAAAVDAAVDRIAADLEEDLGA